MKTLDELQADAKLRNDKELERICNNIKLCVGWSSVIGLFCYIFIIILFKDFN